MNKIQEFEMWCKNMDNQLEQANKAGVPLMVEEEFPLKWLGRLKEDTEFYPPKKKYPNGYWDKIQYWKGKLDEAVKNKDINGVDYAHNKLTYFINSEWERVLNTGDGEVMTRTRFAHLGFNIR
jgi:hypothetical protein